MNECYDTTLECIDWRYSAAMVGLKQYFDFSNDKYERITDYRENQDSISYNQKDINEDRFLAFAEYYFREDMFHIGAENILRSSEEFSQEQIDLVNSKLTGNTVLKKIFEKRKFDGQNTADILELIEQNRKQIIMETFRNKKNLYANYCNSNLLLTQTQPHCRLLGYNIDEGRKSKSAAYNFDATTFVSTDRIEFDFLPFSFTNTYEALFINNNWSFRELYKTNLSFANKMAEEKKEGRASARTLLFKLIMESSEYLDYDIEVIMKSRDKSYYESLFIRRKAIKILKSLGSTKALSISYKVNENYYIDIQREAIECILNEISTDRLIEILLKAEANYSLTIYKLIEVNCRIKELYSERGEEAMKAKLGYTRKCAEEVVKKLEKNKVKSYRQKLTSAIVAEDYDRFCEILLQLSAFKEITFGFIYDLFEDFEKNKDIAYTFIAALDANQGSTKGTQDQNNNISENAQ